MDHSLVSEANRATQQSKFSHLGCYRLGVESGNIIKIKVIFVGYFTIYMYGKLSRHFLAQFNGLPFSVARVPLPAASHRGQGQKGPPGGAETPGAAILAKNSPQIQSLKTERPLSFG